MKLTLEQLKAIFPNSPKSVDAFIPHINNNLSRYAVNTPERLAMFLAQVGHESGQFRYVRELWGPTAQQKKYERDFKATWSANNPVNKLAYQLGNDAVGDGRKYAGRGLIQTTGKSNYRTCGLALGLDLIATPELLETPQYAVLSAFWFWGTRGLNKFADAKDVKGCTLRINGGYNGLVERTEYFNKAMEVLSTIDG